MHDSKIEWTHDTANPWWGCSKVSRACRHCYAETWAARHVSRLSGGRHETVWGPNAPRWLRLEAFERDLRRIARRGDREGRPRRVFIASMSDLFEDRVDLRDARAKVFDLLFELEGRVVPLLLTKRPEVAHAEAVRLGWPAGAWLGITAESQKDYDRRAACVLDFINDGNFPLEPRKFPLFVSIEPMQEAIDLRLETGLIPDWIIVGGESGAAGAQPLHPDWVRDLRDQCATSGVPFFFKQWGRYTEARPDLIPHETIDVETDRARAVWQPKRSVGVALDGRVARSLDDMEEDVLYRHMVRVGKRTAGAVLDGREHRALPSGWLP